MGHSEANRRLFRENKVSYRESGIQEASRPEDRAEEDLRITSGVDMKVPSISRSVHYVAPGSADGRYPPAHRAAVVIEDPIFDPETQSYTCSLFVMNPTGTHHTPHVPYDPTGTAPYSWHWPEYVPEVPD